MADISQELQAILDATYGEEVRGSIHDAIKKIDDVVESAAGKIDQTVQVVNGFASENVERTLLYSYKRTENGTIPDMYHDKRHTLDVELSEIWDYDYLEIFGSNSAFTKIRIPSTLREVCQISPERESMIREAYIQQTSPYHYETSDMSFLDPETMEPLDIGELSIFINTNAFREYDPVYHQPYSSLLYVSNLGEDIYVHPIEWTSKFSLYSYPVPEFEDVDIMAGRIEIAPKYISGPSAEKVPYCIEIKTNSYSVNNTCDTETHVVDTTYFTEHKGTAASMQDVRGIYITDIYGVKSIEPKPIIASGEGENSVIVNDLENNVATGEYAFAEGRGTAATGEQQHVSGRFNIKDTNDAYAEIVGNGTGSDARSNARTLDWNGNEWLAGNLELGPDRVTLSAEKINAFDSVNSFLNNVREIVDLSSETSVITFANGSPDTPVTKFAASIDYISDENGYHGRTNAIVNANGTLYAIDFPDSVGAVYKGTIDVIAGKLTVEMIGSSMLWGDMEFSIDPDNYLGKRIPLPGCYSGAQGAERSFCNMTDQYIYDQSASTHFYIYSDDEAPGYAVVVLPDNTPDDTEIQVLGTLVEPVVYDIDPIALFTEEGSNTFSVDTGSIQSFIYYKISPDIQELKELIEDAGTYEGLFTPTDRIKFDTIEAGAEVNQNAFSSVRVGETVISSVSKNDQLKLDSGSGIDIVPDAETKTLTIKTSSNVPILDMIYPVGSIYMSVNNVDPATLFGGTWEPIKDRFLLSAGDTYGAGDTGGEAEHTLLESELPSLTGSISLRQWGGSSIGSAALDATGKFSQATVGHTGAATIAAGSTTTQNVQKVTYAFGGGNAHNNMPPYLAVYVWKRVA